MTPVAAGKGTLLAQVKRGIVEFGPVPASWMGELYTAQKGTVEDGDDDDD